MRSSYKHPFLWMIVLVGVLFAIVGQVLESTIQSDWKYLFFTVKPAGIGIAVYFTFCALMNFIGTRFQVNKPFTQTWPSLIIVLTGWFAVVTLTFVAMLGIDSLLGFIWMCVCAAGVSLSMPVAFFIRGMAPQTARDL